MPDLTNTHINPNEHTRIADGDHITLHFSVALENGVVVDSTYERQDPVALTMGDGNLLPGFEKALFGLRTGDERTVHLPPEDAFGEWHQANVQHFDKNRFIADNNVPEEGVMMAFEDKAKNTLPGVVQKVTDDEVIVDFNHPLAGKTLTFTVKIFSVTPAGSQQVTLR